MNRLFKPLTYSIQNGEPIIEGYTTDKPIIKDYFSSSLESKLKRWQQSKVDVKVDNSCIHEMNEYAYELWIPSSDVILKDRFSFRKENPLKQGINIDFLADRIEVKEIKTHYKQNVETDYIAVLLPEKKEEFNYQTNLKDIEIISNSTIDAKTLIYNGKTYYPGEQIESIKETLRKYIKHVDDCEGSNFINQLNTRQSDMKFSESEVKLLQSLSNY